MKISFCPWRSLSHPYRVQWGSVYDLVTQQSSGPRSSEDFALRAAWVIRSEVLKYIEELPDRKFLFFFKIKPIAAVACQEARYIAGRAGRVTAFPIPKPLMFARKSDIMMFKLRFGGRL